MPFGGALALAGPLLSGGSALAGLLGGSPASQVNIPQAYQYQNSPGADNNAYSTIGSLGQYNVPAQYLPQYQGITQSMVNNPYAPLYQGGAGQASNMGFQSGANAYGAGGNLMGSSLSTLPDVSALLNLGFDPQNALYSQLQQQNTDQTRAGESARGIAMTPYGAGVENQSNQNFNLAWQNNQLGRAAQGAGAAGGLLGQAGSGVGQGAALQSSGVGQTLQAGQLPYTAFNNIDTNALSALSGAGQFGLSAAQLPQQQVGDYLNYLSGGNSAAATGISGANTALNQANQGFQQNQIMGGQLGQSLAGLSKAWSSPQNSFASAFGGNNGWGSSPYGQFSGTANMAY